MSVYVGTLREVRAVFKDPDKPGGAGPGHRQAALAQAGRHSGRAHLLLVFGKDRLSRRLGRVLCLARPTRDGVAASRLAEKNAGPRGGLFCARGGRDSSVTRFVLICPVLSGFGRFRACPKGGESLGFPQSGA